MNVTLPGSELLAGLRGAHGAVPLEGVRVEARLTGIAAEVTVTQRFRNTEAVAVEAVYTFPLEEGSAVAGFAARVGDRLIRGRVEERDEAFAAYDDALAEGHGAFLLDEERPNVFTTSVGHLRPGEAVEISLTTVAELRHEGEAVRFTVPTTVSPRYVPRRPPEVGEPDGERVNPERWARVPYGLALTVSLEGEGIREVASPTHPIRTQLEDGRVVVSLAQDQVALDRDFVLLAVPKVPHQPHGFVAAEEDGARVAMVTFRPDLTDVAPGPQEVIFLLDCSGSMGGTSIEEARRALALCLRSLAEGDTFDLYRFGSRFESLWGAPRPYGQATLDEATRWIAGIEADLGGTEVLAPMQHLLAAQRDPERPRQILLLTDGQVANEAEVIELCRRSAAVARVFSFGIGAGASDLLVRGVARASGGAAEMIAPGERIEPKVLRTFGRVRSPALTDVRVDWGGASVEQSPTVLPPLFSGDGLTVFGRLPAGSPSGAGQLGVTLIAGGQSFPVVLDLEHAERGGPVPTLWARSVIRELESGDAPQRGSRQARGRDREGDRLVALGQRYGLMSSRTSYVAIEERSDADRADRGAGPTQLRRVPIAITAGWGGGHSGASSGGLAMPGAPLSPAFAPPPLAAPQAAFQMSAPAPRSASPSPKRKKRGLMSALGSLFSSPEQEPMILAESQATYPMAPPHAPSPAADEDPLFEILMSQQADGSFRWSPALERWLGQRLEAARTLARSEGEERVVTALALAWLTREAGARKDEWLAAAVKARRWLTSEGEVEVGEVLPR